MVVEVEQAASKSAAGARNKSTKKKSKVKKAPPPPEKKKKKKKQQQSEEAPPESPSYRLALKSLIFSCRNSHAAPDSSKKPQLGCSSAPSICKQVVDKAGTPPATERRASVSGERCVKKPMSEVSTNNSNSKQLLLQRGGSSSSSSAGAVAGGSFRAGVQLRRLSGCYECHMVVDPIFRDTSSICPCPECGEIFVSQDSLQLHQAMRHAVCELGSDDTSRNIIEIIFQSSWLKKQSPVCRIERILKVHNTARTLARFEDYREAVKAKAKNNTSKNKHQHHYPRCTADGNELLRFHCAALACQLGLDGSTHLCGAATCATCAIIRHGFKPSDSNGIRTMATSGRAHDDDQSSSIARAMLVCRVIAGRVKRPSSNYSNHHHHHEDEEVQEEEEEFESVAGSAGVYSNMEELQVFNPRAILPCFVVIYNAAP